MTSDDHFYTQCKAESFSLTWTITDFSFADGTVQSSIFTNASEESKWTLLMFTCGVPYEEYLSLYFHWISGPKTGIPIKGRMAILNSEGEEAISRGEYVWRFKTLHLLLSPENTQRSQVKVPECSMADDLGDLWDQSLLPDCSLVVAGQEFQAHKAILAARCPVFRAMFMHNMMERQTNRVEIHEMEPEVLKELLTFIYSGKAPNLQDMAAELLVAADMYLLDRLKRMCEEALCRSLTVENAAEILIFADLYLTPNLKEKAITFINQWVMLSQTPGWKTIQKDHPYVMAELFHSLVSAGASPSKRPRLF
uniref:BTB domain-containing protein n=1 Tax=Denticeps clupeoides TaxID=299321 RepID=A0AAY4EH10_9TELE